MLPSWRAAELVAGQDHRRAVREQQRRQQIALLPFARGADAGIVGRSFDAEIVAAIVGVPVLVVLAVGLVVALVVGDEIVEREAVMRGDEVDARPRAAGRANRRRRRSR